MAASRWGMAWTDGDRQRPVGATSRGIRGRAPRRGIAPRRVGTLAVALVRARERAHLAPQLLERAPELAHLGAHLAHQAAQLVELVVGEPRGRGGDPVRARRAPDVAAPGVRSGRNGRGRDRRLPRRVRVGRRHRRNRSGRNDDVDAAVGLGAAVAAGRAAAFGTAVVVFRCSTMHSKSDLSV